MSLNKIDVEVTQETETQAIQGVREVRSLLGFLVGLPAKEKLRLPKLGDSYVEFVNRVRRHAQLHPDYLPQRITLEMFLRDMDACERLQRVSADVKSLDRDLDDTIMLLKSEYYQTSRLFYKAAKNAAKEGDKDAERIANDLAAHYMKRSPGEDEPEDTEDTEDNTNPGDEPQQPV